MSDYKEIFDSKKRSKSLSQKPERSKLNQGINDVRGFFKQVLKSHNPTEVIRTVASNYPEMQWLTGSTNATPESGIEADGKATIGEKIYPNLEKDNLTEFNRTAVGILVLQWILQDDYESFTACQNDNIKLSRESFEQLKQYVQNILPGNKDVEAMITYMVINDLTKIKSIIVDIQEKSEIQNVDHDKLLLVALRNHPNISPSFQRLSSKYKELIINGLSAEFNMGQYVFQENLPADISGLNRLSKEELDFYMVHFLCDVGGVLGHSRQDGSMILTEDYWKVFNLAQNSLSELKNDKTEKEVNQKYLDDFGKLVGIEEQDSNSIAIKKLCCMLKIYSSKEAQEFKNTFNNLHRNVQAILEQELNKNAIDDGLGIRVYYAPALVRNMMSNGKTEEGLTTLARIYQEARIALKNRKENGVYTVMASNAAKMANKNPQDLENHEINLEAVGDDAEIKLAPFSTVDESKFNKIYNLSEIQGETIIPIGMGGGSDCVQAAQLAKLLQESGKQVPAVVSVRTNITGSQGADGKIGEDRIPENAQEISDGVYLITPDTKMKGRALEPVIAKDIPTYLILIKEGSDLTEQIKSLNKHLGNIDTVIGVDTGGDALYSTTGHDQAKATPDQDIQVLKAINKLQGVNILSAEIAIGVDTPENGEDVLLKANARYFEPNEQQAASVIKQYVDWEMDGSNDQHFGKTSLSWQKALKDETGLQAIDLPTRVVIDENNPWETFVNIQPSTKGIFFMNTDSHLQAIER